MSKIMKGLKSLRIHNFSAMLGGITAAVVVIMLLVIHYRRDPIAMMVKAR